MKPADTTVHYLQKAQKRGEQGFTLLETLMALAMMSIISLALFQSLGQMLAVSDRAVRIGNNAFDQFSNDAGYRDFVGDIIGTWTQIDPFIFKGNGQQISGLAVSPLIVDQQTGAQNFTLSLESLPEQNNLPPQFRLILESPGLSPNSVGLRPKPILAVFEGQSPRFVYLSYDETPRTLWPPETVPSPGILTDHNFMDIPRLPHAIGLEYEKDGQTLTLWARTRNDINLSLGFDRDIQ